MTGDLACAGCGSLLQRGFIIDRGHYDSKSPQAWVEGEPESSFWSGLKTSDREIRRVDAYRCTRCGRLDFFAVEHTEIW